MTTNTHANGANKDDQDELLQLPPRKATCGVSFPAAFSALWTDETFHDLTLQGSDGVQVTCNRAALASTNRVWKKMLFGPFQEANSDVVDLQFPGETLQAVVEYLHTNQATLLKPGLAKEGTATADQIESFVTLVGAAFFFDLHHLCYQAMDGIQARLENDPSCLFAVLEACSEQVMPVPCNVRELAFSFLWSSSVDLKNISVIGRLSPSVLEDLLGCPKSPMNEFDMFQILNSWFKVEDPGFEQENRKLIAMDLIQNIDLARIHPTKLSTDVASSGLVTTDQLCEAYKTQSLASTQSKIDFECLRDAMAAEQVHWKMSRSVHFTTSTYLTVLDTFAVEPVAYGKFSWTIRVEKSLDRIAIGIVNPAVPMFTNCHCGTNLGHWGYGNSGYAQHNNVTTKWNLPSFSSGSKVTMILTLLGETGVLSASVDDGDEFVVFQDIRKYNSCHGFIPAASMHGPNEIQIVEYKRLKW